MSLKKSKGRSVTMAQKEALVEFMENNVELKRGKFTSNFTHKNAQHLWEQITQLLNSMVGANKTADKWRKCWIDMKCNAKTKCIKKSTRKTGGGSYELENELAPLDEKIVGVIGDVPIYGQPRTHEPTVSFEGYQILLDSSTNSLQPQVESLVDCERRETETCLPELLLPPSIEPMSTYIKPLQDFIMTDNTSKDKSYREDTVGLKTKNRKQDVLQKSVKASLQVISISEDRNKILKEYYTQKLQLLERIAIAKERKVALMEANISIINLNSNCL